MEDHASIAAGAGTLSTECAATVPWKPCANAADLGAMKYGAELSLDCVEAMPNDRGRLRATWSLPLFVSSAMSMVIVGLGRILALHYRSLYTILINIFGAAISEATTRPNPR